MRILNFEFNNSVDTDCLENMKFTFLRGDSLKYNVALNAQKYTEYIVINGSQCLEGQILKITRIKQEQVRKSQVQDLK